MSIVRKLLSQIIAEKHKQNQELQLYIQGIIRQMKTFKIQQLQQFIREISHLVYQRQETIQIQIIAITIIKELLITASFSAFLFSNIYIFPWVISICNYQHAKSFQSRAKLLFKETNSKVNAASNKNIERHKKLLILCEQFLIFFGQNLKFHPCSKFKIKSTLCKYLQTGLHKNSLQYYTSHDLMALHNNIKKNLNFRKQLNELTDFINTKIQQCMEDSSKFHENLFLLISLIEISQSYCITTTAFRLCSFFTPQKIEIACQIADYIISTAQIEAVESINIRCVPLLLQYLLPVNFKENAVRQTPKTYLQSNSLNKLIDYYYVWYQKTKILKLSTKIYEYSYGMVEYLKKPFKLSFQNPIKQFKVNLQKRQQNNQIKRSFIIDQHEQQQQKIINLLKQAAFCINSKQVQRQIAYQNVLDDLTITEKQTINQFSQSLIRSLKGRQDASLNSKQSIQGHQSKRKYGIEDSKQIENIYYNRNTKKSLVKASKIDVNKQGSSNRSSRSKYYQQQHQSQREIKYPSFPIVTSRGSRGITDAKSESMLSLHSSQFSQKDNKQIHRYNSNKEAQSVYQNKQKNLKGKDQNSGQFLYFQKESEIKSNKTEQKQSELFQHQHQQQIEFKDSLKNINESQSCQILQFGMDAHAKMPPSVSKPKFNFKSQETDDSSMILKDISTTPKKQLIQASQKGKKISTPIAAYYQSESDKIQTTPKASKLQIKSPNIPSSYVKDTIKLKSNAPSQSSSSIIRQNSAEPHVISQSLSFSNQKMPSKFGEVFKQKSEKASVLSSSRSLKRLKNLPQRQVQIPDFKKLRDLQNQLGRLKKQTEQYNKQLVQKKKQMTNLQKKKIQINQSDPYYLKKENQIMKILLKNKGKQIQNMNSQSSAKLLTKQLKQSSIKNYAMSLKDYNTDVLKLKFQNIKAYTKEQRKNIISNRCILLKNNLIQLGYSFKNNFVTLYLTLKNYCQSLQINLVQNSIIFSQQIKRQFSKLYVGKQMKFKTQVNTTKDSNTFIPSSVNIKISYLHKLDIKNEQFCCNLPLTPYNIAIPLQQNQVDSLISSQSNKSSYVTPLYTSSQDLFKKGKPYLLNIFPHGYFNQDSSMFTINYKWKQRIETINIKLKQRAFRIQGIGYPLQSGKQLIETVISLVTDPQ